MQVSSVTIQNGRIRSAIPLDESKIETHKNGLKKLAETRMSRVEMEREESVHDDLVFEYSSRYREFSGRVRKNQASMSIQSSDEDDYKENRKSKLDNHQQVKKRNDSQDNSPYKKTTNKFSESSKKKSNDLNNSGDIQESEHSEDEIVLGEITSRSRKDINNSRASKFLDDNQKQSKSKNRSDEWSKKNYYDEKEDKTDMKSSKKNSKNNYSEQKVEKEEKPSKKNSKKSTSIEEINDLKKDTYFAKHENNIKFKRDLNPLPETSIKIKPSKKKTKNEIEDFQNENSFTNKTNLFITSNEGRSPSPDLFMAKSVQLKNRKSMEIGNEDGAATGNESDAEIYPGTEGNENENEDSELLENDYRLEYFDLLIDKNSRHNIVDFIQSISPADTKIRCKLIIDRGIFNEYTLYLENFNGSDLALMTTKRKKASAKVVYQIMVLNESKENFKFGFIESNLTRRAYDLIGNLSANNENSNEFYENNKHLEDNQHDDRYSSSKSMKIDKENQKQNGIHYFELEYTNKMIGRSKPKDLSINLEIPIQNKRTNKSEVQTKLKTLRSKKPEYDSKSKTYRLDFKGRAKLPSTNNVQIVDENDSKTIVMQLGKMKSKHYSLDFSYPFCAYTAFGVAISCLSRN